MADTAHRAAADEMVRWYEIHGSDDVELEALARAVREKNAAEKAADKRKQDLSTWIDKAELATRAAGKPIGYPEHFAEWFEDRFDDGLTPEAAAHLAVESDLK